MILSLAISLECLNWMNNANHSSIILCQNLSGERSMLIIFFRQGLVSFFIYWICLRVRKITLILFALFKYGNCNFCDVHKRHNNVFSFDWCLLYLFVLKLKLSSITHCSFVKKSFSFLYLIKAWHYKVYSRTYNYKLKQDAFNNISEKNHSIL